MTSPDFDSALTDSLCLKGEGQRVAAMSDELARYIGQDVLLPVNHVLGVRWEPLLAVLSGRFEDSNDSELMTDRHIRLSLFTDVDACISDTECPDWELSVCTYDMWPDDAFAISYNGIEAIKPARQLVDARLADIGKVAADLAAYYQTAQPLDVATFTGMRGSE